MKKLRKLSMLIIFGAPIAMFGYFRARGSVQESGNWLRNDEGVGPAHQRGVQRGEAQSIHA